MEGNIDVAKIINRKEIHKYAKPFFIEAFHFD
jgi:hypothetical protein